MNEEETGDIIEARLDRDSNPPRLYLHLAGPDRPGVVADVSTLLEDNRLIIETITFNLSSPRHNQYYLEIIARGDLKDMRRTKLLIDAESFLEMSSSPTTVSANWQSTPMLHVCMNTPDQVGLIAKMARIVSGKDEKKSTYPRGSFTHLMGILDDGGGPEGGTPYFWMRANITVQTQDLKREMVGHIEAWAKKNSRDSEIWTISLDKP